MLAFPKWFFSRISWKFFAMTIVFVMASALMVLVPLLGFAQRSWLESRMQTAQVAARALASGAGERISPSLGRDIRREMGFLSLSVEEKDAHHLLLRSEGMKSVSRQIDLGSESVFGHMRGALWTFFRAEDASLRILGRDKSDPSKILAIVIHEGALKKALFYDACGALLRGFSDSAFLWSFAVSCRARDFDSSLARFGEQHDRLPRSA